MTLTWADALPTLSLILTVIALCYTAARYTSDKAKDERAVLSSQQKDDTAVIRQLAVLETKVDNLTTVVNKHNNVIERTYNVERDSKTMWIRIDENKAAIKEIQKDIEQLKVINGAGGTE